MRAFFTGHRYVSRNYPGCYSGIKQLIDLARERGTTEFDVGMALGTDQLAAEILTGLGMKWNAVIPCADQAELWKRADKSNYKKLLEFARDRIILYPSYSPGVMQARNRYMVKRSQICLAVYNLSTTGGTAMTVKLAYARNLQVIIYNPSTQDISIINPKFEQLSLF